MKSKQSMSMEGVYKGNKISQSESPSSEHEISNVVRNASFSKVTVRRKFEENLLEIVDEKDSVNSITSTPIKHFYSYNENLLDKKKDKTKKMKDKSSGNDIGLISDVEYNVFKPKKKKRIIKDGFSIAEVASTSPKPPKNYNVQFEDIKSVVHETEITQDSSETNMLQSTQISGSKDRKQHKRRNNDSLIEDEECLVGDLILPTKSPKKKIKQQKYLEELDNTIQTHDGEQLNKTIEVPITTLLSLNSHPSFKETFEGDLKVDQEVNTTRSAQVKLQLFQQITDANHDNSLNKKSKKEKRINCQLDEEINKNNLKTSSSKNKKKKSKKSTYNSKDVQSDNDNNSEAKLSCELTTIASPVNKVEHKCIDLKTLCHETEIALPKVSSKFSNPSCGDDKQMKNKKKIKSEKVIENSYIEELDLTNPNELITSGSRKKKNKHKPIDNSYHVIKSNCDRHNTKEANNTSLATVSLGYIEIASFNSAKSQVLKETSDGEDSALKKPAKHRKTKVVITDVRSSDELSTTSPKRKKKEKSSNQLADDHRTSSGSSIGNEEVIRGSLSHERSKNRSEHNKKKGHNLGKCVTLSSGETQLMDHKNEKKFEICDTSEKEKTDDLLGSDSSVFKFKHQSTNPTLLINCAGTSPNKKSERNKQSKHLINDRDIITARLLKNALKESRASNKNTLEQQNKPKLKSEKKNNSLSSSNLRTRQDLSGIEKSPNDSLFVSKQKSKTDLTKKDRNKRKHKSNKAHFKNEIEKMKQDLLSAALKRISPNSVDKSSDPINLKCIKESVKSTGNNSKAVKIDKSTKKHSKSNKTKIKDSLDKITSKMLAEALARSKTNCK